MGYTAAAKNSMLDGLVGKAAPVVITHLSTHTGDPGATGANESVDGGYGRVAVSEADWAAAAGGEVVLGGDEAFVGTPLSAATHFGAWSGSTFAGGGALAGDQAYNAEGAYVLKAGTKLDLNLV